MGGMPEKEEREKRPTVKWAARGWGLYAAVFPPCISQYGIERLDTSYCDV